MTLCVSVLLPDGKDPAEIIHDIVELNLQVLKKIAGLHAQLKHGYGNTQSWLCDWAEFCNNNTPYGHIWDCLDMAIVTKYQ